jgi:nucleoside phosphorylase
MTATGKLADNRRQADVLLVTATRVESEMLQAELRRCCGRSFEPCPQIGLGYHYLGEIKGAPIYHIQSMAGSGTVGGSIITVRDAIDRLDPGWIIMVGIAFGIHQGRHHEGDILVSRQILAYEVGKIHRDGRLEARGDRVTASEELLKATESARLRWDGPAIELGLILSGEKVVDHADFRDELLRIGPGAIGGEMEGSGLYVAARSKKKDWIVVKAICDWADGNKGDNFQPLAATNAARFVLHLLQQGGFSATRAAGTSAAGRAGSQSEQRHDTGRTISTGGGDYVEGVSIKGSSVSGTIIGVNKGTVSTQHPGTAGLEQLHLAVRQAAEQARRRGDDDLADDLATVAQTLDVALKAQREGKGERRAAKLAEARAALLRLAAGQADLARLVELLDREG